MKNERIVWIDIARAIGILAVIYGHVLSWDSHRYLLYAFHIPLFFFISGLVHHYKKTENVKEVLTKSIKNILLPYFVFSILTYIVVLATQGFSTFSVQSISYQLLGILYGSGNLNFLSFNVALWFLPCLFITKIGFTLLEKISNTKKFLIISIIFCSLLGYALSIYLRELKLPFGIESALTGIVFFGSGYLVGSIREKVTSILSRYGLLILPICIILCFVIATTNFEIYGYQIDLRLNKLANYFYFYIAAISGIISCVVISVLLGKNRLLEYIGRNSITLYIWHWPLFGIFNKLTNALISKETINLIRNAYLAPLYTVSSITLILLLKNMFLRLKLRINE